MSYEDDYDVGYNVGYNDARKRLDDVEKLIERAEKLIEASNLYLGIGFVKTARTVHGIAINLLRESKELL
jgi:hypothetical protein